MDHWYCEEDGKLYFHCAKEGHKLDALKACSKASYCVYDQDITKKASGVEHSQCSGFWADQRCGRGREDKIYLHKSVSKIYG